MVDEPIGGEARYGIKCATFFEEVSGTGHAHQLSGTRELGKGIAIQA